MEHIKRKVSVRLTMCSSDIYVVISPEKFLFDTNIPNNFRTDRPAWGLGLGLRSRVRFRATIPIDYPSL